MLSQLQNKEVLLATQNPGKLKEFKHLLRPLDLELKAIDMQAVVPEETGQTFHDNALIKAQHAAKQYNMIALADDSGLVIDALDGFPGVTTGRWLKKLGLQGVVNYLQQALQDKDPQAHFECVLVLCWPGGEHREFKGRVHGHLELPPRGDNGFGFDPLFVPAGETKTFAEMTAQEKHQFSHRAQAVQELICQCHLAN